MPKNTPVEIIDKLNKEINVGLADPKMKARLVELGADLAVGAAALPAVSRVAKAQTYPTRPITVIVPYAAGEPRLRTERLRGLG